MHIFIRFLYIYFFFKFSPEKKSETATPKKVYSRNIPVSQEFCRLCASPTEKSRLINVFHKAGREKELKEKILRTTGVVIQEGDVLPKAICRPCERKVSGNWSFRYKCQQNQINLRQNISVKRHFKSPSDRKLGENELVDKNSGSKSTGKSLLLRSFHYMTEPFQVK